MTRHYLIWIILLFTTFASLPMAANDHQSNLAELNLPAESFSLVFSERRHFSQAMLVHDTVMGGRSNGTVRLLADNTAVAFLGELSLANNGGFASVEFTLAQAIPELFNKLTLSAIADGRTYQLRLKTNKIRRSIAYVAEFKTDNKLQPYEFTPEDFVGRFRGRLVPNMPELLFSDIRQISIMVADKYEGPFRIDLHGVQFSQVAKLAAQ